MRRVLEEPLKWAVSLASSVAPAPLSGPRSDGVATLTAYGPCSVTLPPASVIRSFRVRGPAASRVGWTVSFLRFGQGLRWRNEQARPVTVRAPAA